MALSDKSKVEDFFMTSTDAGSSGHSIYSGSSGSTQESYKKLEIFTTTIDDLMKSYRINNINHLKIDVDGCDYQVLLGGEKALSNRALKTILVEGNDQANDIINLLNKYGFEQVEIASFKDAGTRENIGFVRL